MEPEAKRPHTCECCDVGRKIRAVERMLDAHAALDIVIGRRLVNELLKQANWLRDHGHSASIADLEEVTDETIGTVCRRYEIREMYCKLVDLAWNRMYNAAQTRSQIDTAADTMESLSHLEGATTGIEATRRFLQQYVEHIYKPLEGIHSISDGFKHIIGFFGWIKPPNSALVVCALEHDDMNRFFARDEIVNDVRDRANDFLRVIDGDLCANIDEGERDEWRGFAERAIEAAETCTLRLREAKRLLIPEPIIVAVVAE